jgi:transcriptional regulator with AAA-type ATPase domain
MKTLITWLGYNEDFEVNGAKVRVKETGFTPSIHTDVFDARGFDKHVILFTTDENTSENEKLKTRKKMLLDFLKKNHAGRCIETYDLLDKKYLQDFKMIESSLRSFIQTFSPDEELSVIAGTGPTAVAMSWNLLHLTMDNRFNLFLLQMPHYTKNGKTSELIPVELIKSSLLDAQLRRQAIQDDLPNDIYRDPIVDQEYNKAKAIANAKEINILILGETGCGKDRLAEYILKNSPLCNESYKAINCASLSDDLLYSELFGHEQGSFTGATKSRDGLFEACAGGTLFMDEIGDISLYMQQSILRTLENWEIKKLGSNEVKKIKRVRIIAATNQQLYDKCKAGKFRFDLYYRLCSMEIELTPFRNRTKDERVKVIKYYLDLLSKKWGRKQKFTTEARRILEQYDYLGNFREIYNTLNGVFGLDMELIDEMHLPSRFKNKDSEIIENYNLAMRKHCLSVYEKYNFNMAATCKALGYKNTTQLKKNFIDWGIMKE